MFCSTCQGLQVKLCCLGRLAALALGDAASRQALARRHGAWWRRRVHFWYTSRSAQPSTRLRRFRRFCECATSHFPLAAI
jgi:hypothetical protein